MIGVVVTAAGSSTRMGGGASKVLLQLGGRSVLEHSLASLREALPEAAVVVTTRREDRERVAVLARGATVVLGGATRQKSVLLGVEALPLGVRHVLVHDAARPLASPALFRRTLEAVETHGAAAAGLPASDSLHALDAPGGSRLLRSLERSGLFAAQTPQGARAAWLRAALAQAEREGLEATDEAALLLAAGHPVFAVEGEASNLKLTRREDLPLFEALLARVRPHGA